MEFLRNLFGKKINAGDFSRLATDMHSHLLPGIDDGSENMETSIALIRELKKQGFRKLITTPHVMGDQYRNTSDIIMNGLHELNHTLASHADISDMQVTAAAEYYLDAEFIEKLQSEKLLTMGDNFLLVEISYLNCPENFFDLADLILASGYRLILAHPERYPYWHGRTDIYGKMKSKGVFFQINLNSLSGYYGPQVKRAAETLIDLHHVEFAGTDVHHARHTHALASCTASAHFEKILDSGKLLNGIL
jgi:tyrosine-protein phosphatase YwqE